MPRIRSFVRKLARVIVQDYTLYWVVELQLKSDVQPGRGVSTVSSELTELLETPHAEVRRTISYAGSEAAGFCIIKDGHAVAVCWFWWGKRYEERGYWPLDTVDAKLVQIVVADSYRGQGLASELLRSASAEMLAKGFKRLYARIWHSNKPSLRAFAKAGWRKRAFVLEVRYHKLRPPLRLEWPRRSRVT